MGGAGTLGEISHGYYAGKIMGFLKGSGGCSDIAMTVLKSIYASGQTPNGTIFFENKNPKILLNKAIKEYERKTNETR